MITGFELKRIEPDIPKYSTTFSIGLISVAGYTCNKQTDAYTK